MDVECCSASRYALRAPKRPWKVGTRLIGRWLPGSSDLSTVGLKIFVTGSTESLELFPRYIQLRHDQKRDTFSRITAALLVSSPSVSLSVLSWLSAFTYYLGFALSLM
jgi:hypothetical protein